MTPNWEEWLIHLRDVVPQRTSTVAPHHEYQHWKEGCKEGGAKFCSVVPSGHQQTQRNEFPQNTRKQISTGSVTELWHRLSRVVVKSPPPDIFKSPGASRTCKQQFKTWYDIQPILAVKIIYTYFPS